MIHPDFNLDKIAENGDFCYNVNINKNAYEHTMVCYPVCSCLKNMAVEKYVRKVVKNGRGSYYLNIPKEIARDLKIRERQKLEIHSRGKSIIVRDWEK